MSDKTSANLPGDPTRCGSHTQENNLRFLVFSWKYVTPLIRHKLPFKPAVPQAWISQSFSNNATCTRWIRNGKEKKVITSLGNISWHVLITTYEEHQFLDFTSYVGISDAQGGLYIDSNDICCFYCLLIWTGWYD